MSYNSTPKSPKIREKNAKICPQCGTDKDVIPLLYGLPSHEALKLAERDQVKLGGCDISENGIFPQFYCKIDHLEF